MAEEKKPRSYRERVAKVKHQLYLQQSDLVKWATDNGYRATQVYTVTRRTESPKCGISLEIAEKLGLIGEQS